MSLNKKFIIIKNEKNKNQHIRQSMWKNHFKDLNDRNGVSTLNIVAKCGSFHRSH